MWKRSSSLLIVLSLTLNVAFVGYWAVRVLGAKSTVGGLCSNGAEECSLHQRLATNQGQSQRIEPVVAAFREEAQAVCTEVTRARMELLDLLAAPEPDGQLVAARREEILAGQRRMQGLVINHILAVKELLTSDQREDLFDLLRRRSRCAGPAPLMGQQGGQGGDG